MYFIFMQKLTGDTLSLQMVTFLEKAVLINSTYIYILKLQTPAAVLL